MFKIHSPETVPEKCSMFMLAKFPGAKLVRSLEHLQKANPNKVKLLSICVYLNYWRSPSHGSGLNMYK